MDSLQNTDDPVEILADPSSLIVYAWKNILIFVWLGDAGVELMRRLNRLLTVQTREVGTISIVSIVTTVGDLPDDAKRRAYKELTSAHRDSFAYIAMVLEREGFVGSAVRGLATGLLMVTRRQNTLHVANNFEQAAAWLAPKHAQATGVTFEVDELVRALRVARTRAAGSPSPGAGA